MTIKSLIKPIVKFPIELIASKFGHHRRKAASPRLWIMMYHRILPHNDPRYLIEEPGMIVEPETFRMHLRTLKNEFTMISLADWVNRKKNNLPLPMKACAITFDDGWSDNYEFAFPILQQEQIPATLFVVSDMIGTNQTFWPNRLQSILRHPAEQLATISWLSGLVGKNNASKELSAKVIHSLKHYSDTKLNDLIEDAETKLNISLQKSPTLINFDQLIEMSNSGINIGSHTCNHIRLSEGLEDKTYHNEILNSKKRLENILDKTVDLFCYPNGNFCDKALNEVAKHYDAAVTTNKGINSVLQSNLYTLTRFAVHEDIANNKRQLLSKVADWPF